MPKPTKTPDQAYSPMQTKDANYLPMVEDKDNIHTAEEANYQPMVVDEAQEANYQPMVVDEVNEDYYQPMVVEDKPEDSYQPMVVNDDQAVDDIEPMHIRHPAAAPNDYGPMQVEEEAPAAPEENLSVGHVKQKAAGARVISKTGNKYQLYKRLSDNQSEKLRRQTQLNRQNSNLSLGSGNFGDVLIAKQKASELNPSKFVAVKVIQKDVALFEKENTFYSIVDERKIDGLLVPIETIKCEDTNTIYQFMPLANFGDGRRLNRELANLPRKDKDVVIRSVTAQLLQATANMHDNHTYHLDMKPDNFLIDLTGKVYLADFGAAVAYNNNGKLIYSPDIIKTDARYHTPEIGVARGEDRYRLIDQWRLGLTLAKMVCTDKESKAFLKRELLTNASLRAGNTYEQEIQHFQPLLAKLSDILDKENIPADVKAVIQGLVELDPRKRLDPKVAIGMLNQPTEANEKAKHVFSGFVPKQQPVEVKPEVLVSRKNLSVFSDLVKEVSQYSEKHRKWSVISIQKRQAADRVLHILSTKSVNDPNVVTELKALIAKEEIILKHQHFHHIKKWFGKDVEIIAKTKKLVAALENKQVSPANKWYYPLFETMKKAGDVVQRKVGNVAILAAYLRQKTRK